MGVEAPSVDDQEVILCRLRVQGKCYNFNTMEDERGKLVIDFVIFPTVVLLDNTQVQVTQVAQ